MSITSWAYAKSGYRFPFGFDRRVVLPDEQRFASQGEQLLAGSVDMAQRKRKYTSIQFFGK